MFTFVKTNFLIIRKIPLLLPYLVAELMRRLGYKMVDKVGPTPKGCVAMSGELWSK